MQMQLGGPLINLLFIWNNLIKYAQNDRIVNFKIFGDHTICQL